jgi:hypothetical protein
LYIDLKNYCFSITDSGKKIENRCFKKVTHTI